MSTTTYQITAAELAEGKAQIAALELELIIANDRLEEQLVYMSHGENARDHSAQRRKAQLAHDVTSTEQQIVRLERFLASAGVTDDQPEPPSPAAPAIRPVAIPAPTRFRVSVAWFHSTCGLSGQRIRPNDEITNFEGKWCLYTAAAAEDDRRRAEGMRRRADLVFVEAFASLVDRLPVAVAA
jgi:hypothetical protein